MNSTLRAADLLARRWLVKYYFTLWGASYSACVACTKTIIHLSVNESGGYIHHSVKGRTPDWRLQSFSLCFKMAESFENLDNILPDWANDKLQKSLAETLNKFEKQEEER